MKVFVTSDYNQRFIGPLCESASDITSGKAEVKRFPNGEIHALVQENVDNEECLVIASVAPPDEQLLALLSLADALKRSGAARIHAFLPYLGYARQDKIGDGESGGIALIGSLVKAAGIDQITSFDIHGYRDKKLIGLPLRSLSPAPIFAVALTKTGWLNPTVVAPDYGAMERTRKLAHVLGITTPVPHLIKRRVDGVVHIDLKGTVSSQVVLVDDIIDSGRTLISACKILRSKGVKEIVVAVTHGLFTGDAWKEQFDLGVEALYVSDSCPEASLQNHPKVHILPLEPLMPEVATNVMRKEKQYENIVA